MKIQLSLAELPAENVSVTVSGSYLQVAYDFEKMEQSSIEDETMRNEVDNSYMGEYIELRGGVRSYDAIASAIIEDKYPSDKMDAIRLNYELAQNADTTGITLSDEKKDEYIAEHKAMQEWRIHAKEVAKTAVELIEEATK